MNPAKASRRSSLGSQNTSPNCVEAPIKIYGLPAVKDTLTPKLSAGCEMSV
jgi:hypothetical protein